MAWKKHSYINNNTLYNEESMIATTLEKSILEKMLRHQYIGAKHTSIDNLPKGFPKHLRKDVLEAARDLIKKGYITAKPTSYGMEVSLNPTRLKETIKLLDLTEHSPF